LKKRSKGTFFC